MQKINKNKKWIFIGGGILVVAIITILLINSRNTNPATQAESGDIVTVFVGDLSGSAAASGTIDAQQAAQLALMASGEVAEVPVQVGMDVQTGDVLVKLDTAELERAVLNAQQSLAIQEANLATLLVPSTDADVADSEAAVASAQAQLDDLLDGPNDTDIAAAEANVRAANGDIAAAYARFDANRAAPTAAEIQAAELELQLAQQAATSAAEQHTRILVTEPNKYLAEDDLADIEYSARVQAVQANADLAAAQQKYDDLINGDANTISGSQANLAAATASRDAAQAQLDQLLAGPSEAETASAEANLAQAKANLDRLRRGPSQAQITLSEAQVEQARISLQRTQNNLENAILRAPFDGTITAVNVSPGEQANGILVELVNNDSLEVVLDVDEVDLGEMSIGQPAVVTLESWPDVEIDGAIITIAPKANQDNSALVTYAVNLSLDATDLPILVGMTANADLITSNREGVLLVPNAAINADRTAGTYSVNLVEIDADGNETTTEIPVTIGLRDNQFTQITSGLQAGDRVMVGNIVPLRNPFGPDSDGGNGDNGPGGNNNDGGPFGG